MPQVQLNLFGQKASTSTTNTNTPLYKTPQTDNEKFMNDFVVNYKGARNEAKKEGDKAWKKRKMGRSTCLKPNLKNQKKLGLKSFQLMTQKSLVKLYIIH